MKTCTKCRIGKAETEFHRRKAGKGGRSSVCKKCTALYLAKYRYGLNDEELRAMLAEQTADGVVCCAICGVSAGYIDHDHSTGEVRGILCRDHNSLLGAFRDDIDLLNRALAFLRAAEINWAENVLALTEDIE